MTRPRLLLAGTGSGCGKTTLTCALLAAYLQRGLDVAAFKCGPDYIDPMFHRVLVGEKSHNLDPFFCSGELLRSLFCAHAGRALSVIEGVMGYYDGIACTERASTWEVARALSAPGVLVATAAGMANSVGAVLHGFRTYKKESGLFGVIFSGLSAGMYRELAEVAQAAGLTPLGFLPWEPDCELPHRHLGLVTAAEIDDLRPRLQRLGELARQHIDLDALLSLAQTAPALDAEPLPFAQTPPGERVRIAVARDAAFCFLYPENLELLAALGCEPVFFSPLTDAALPQGIGALYLCGGYPELHLGALSGNKPMLADIRAAIARGLPTFAECGGFLYLHETLDGFPLVGALPAQGFETKKLARFGYHTLTAERDNLLCRRGERIPAHEFHYWDSTDCGADFTAHKAGRQRSHQCVHATDRLWAGFPHLYLYANPAFAARFAERARSYVRENPAR